MFTRLEEDHQNARYLASCLAETPCIKLDQASVQTNMIFFDVNLPADLKIDFHKQLKAQGVLVSSMPNRMARAVTHFGLDRADMEEVAQIIKNIALIFAAKAID
jgi:threonine aldolase